VNQQLLAFLYWYLMILLCSSFLALAICGWLQTRRQSAFQKPGLEFFLVREVPSSFRVLSHCQWRRSSSSRQSEWMGRYVARGWAGM
jgi:hypothetical protein